MNENARTKRLSSYSAEELIRELKERPQAIDNILFAVSAERLIAELRNRKGDEMVAIFLQMLDDDILSNELTNRGYVVNVR